MRGQTGVIWVSIASDAAIAATKFIAAAVTGSSAMLAEGMHSVVDVCDVLLLLFGRHRAARPPDESHPLGHGKDLYFWTLIVAILFFALGGGMSIYEGLLHLSHPDAMARPGWNYVVLGVASVFVLFSFVVTVREFRTRLHGRGVWRTLVETKDPTLATLVLSDAADVVGIAIAFVGVALAHWLRLPWIDGAASIGVGVLLSAIAIFLIVQSEGLLIGERAAPEVAKRVRAAAAQIGGIVDVERLITLQFGPGIVLVGMDVIFDPRLHGLDVATTIDRLEERIRRENPDVRYVYVEAQVVTRVAEQQR